MEFQQGGMESSMPPDSEDSYRNIFNSVANAVYIQDLTGIFLEVNDSALRMAGYAREDFLGRTSEFISAPGMNEGVDLDSVYEKVASGIPQQFEWWGRRKNGSVFPQEMMMTRGRFKGRTVIISAARDISETKMLQAQFLRAQRLESLGTLAGGIAHDLNNVLAPIILSVQILRTKLESERRERALTAIEVSATRGKEILQQVLTFAKGVDGDTTVFHPKLLLRELEHLIRETFPRSIQIRTQVPNDLWMLCASVTRVHQVLMNLCVNARDAMPDGGTLGIAIENICIDENFARLNVEAKTGSYIVFTVTDTGSGIPPEIIDRIFDPFFTTKEQGRGTGLGLSTVHSIVKGYGGFVTVASELSVGTTIKVFLPAVFGGEEAKTPGPIPSMQGGNGECILLVDDEQSILNVTTEILEMNGYRVLAAMNGKEALAAYEANRESIVLVLTDIMMPLMDGYTMIRTLRTVKPELKIIASSGLPVTSELVEPAATAADAFISKPYSVDALLTMIGNVMRRSAKN
ncbi:MAG: ATP-binding protein [Acidobacteriota bacterium]